MSIQVPSLTREYKNHHLDSTRWQSFVPRNDDIIVSTSYKSGTTWMQQILHLILFKDTPDALPVGLVSPWIDARFQGPLDEVMAGLEAQTHRRFVKSHLPFDGLPYYAKVKYVVVARDARDVFMSFWNHYQNYTDEIMQRLNDRDGWSGDSLPYPPKKQAIRESWRRWISQGWFEWESEGWPFWSNLHHTETYWPARDLENVLLFHYSDMLADLPGEVSRLAKFIDIELNDEEHARIVEAATFKNMKKAFKPMDEMLRRGFKGGSDSFIFKGTNGRWRDVLNEEDLALYEDAMKRVLSPECAAWLETGWLG